MEEGRKGKKKREKRKKEGRIRYSFLPQGRKKKCVVFLSQLDGCLDVCVCVCMYVCMCVCVCVLSFILLFTISQYSHFTHIFYNHFIQFLLILLFLLFFLFLFHARVRHSSGAGNQGLGHLSCVHLSLPLKGTQGKAQVNYLQ